MANENLYQKYLGIFGTGKPNYYTLLGVAVKESNSEVLVAAAEQRINALGTVLNPENQGEIAILVSEITTARDVLLDAQKRRQYEFEFLLNSSMMEKNTASAPQPEAPAQAPFTFQPQAPVQPQTPAQAPFTFQPQAPVQPQTPAQAPFAFQPQAPAPAQPMQAQSPFSSPASTTPAPVMKVSHSRKKTVQRDNTPMIAAIIGGVVVIMVLLWCIGNNSPRSQAEKLYNQAVTAVNSYRYDEARELMDRAIALDKQEMYVKYRNSIDKKQKNHEYTMRHKAARESETEEEAW